LKARKVEAAPPFQDAVQQAIRKAVRRQRSSMRQHAGRMPAQSEYPVNDLTYYQGLAISGSNTKDRCRSCIRNVIPDHRCRSIGLRCDIRGARIEA
jgi:hypothetical protein